MAGTTKKAPAKRSVAKKKTTTRKTASTKKTTTTKVTSPEIKYHQSVLDAREELKKKQELEAQNAKLDEADAEKAQDQYEAIKAAVAAKDGEKLQSLIDSVRLPTLKVVGADNELVKSIIDDVDQTIGHKVCDKLYEGIRDVESMKDLIQYRFGVKVGTGRTNVEDYHNKWEGEYYKSKYDGKDSEWTTEGLTHVYRTYMKMPQSHLDEIVVLVCENSTNGSGGAAYGDTGVYYVNYSGSKLDQREGHSSASGTHTDSRLRRSNNYDTSEGATDWVDGYLVGKQKEKSDTSEGLVMFDKTIAHELGHVIDHKGPSGPFSEQNDFRVLSGWKAHPKSDLKGLVDYIWDQMTEPVDPAMNMTPSEVALGKVAAQRIIKKRAVNATDANYIIQDLVNEKKGSDFNKLTDTELASVEKKQAEAKADYDKKYHEYQEEYKNYLERLALYDKYGWDKSKMYVPTEPERPDIEKTIDDSSIDVANLRDAEALYDAIQKMPLIKHIQRAFEEKSPWYYGERFDNMKRQIHEGYSWENNWYSYDNSAWEGGKISLYQYRNPMEEFAELYASYHVADTKGSHTPDRHKKWFEAQGLHLALPDKNESSDAPDKGEATH